MSPSKIDGILGNRALAKKSSIIIFHVMKIAVLISALLSIPLLAQLETQHAKASWLTEETKFGNGESIRTVIKMEISKGWHTYWKNPGEGGIPLKIQAILPEGWTTGEIQYPAPKRFETGILPSYGYEGVVHFPLTLTPPKGTDGQLPELVAKLTWLTCNESSCVPGEAKLILETSAEAKLIQTAYQSIPSPLDSASLSFIATKSEVTITLTLPEGSKIDPSTYEAFPVTPDIISASHDLRFSPHPEKPMTWICKAKSSDYIPEKPTSLTIEFFKKNEPSWIVTSGNQSQP